MARLRRAAWLLFPITQGLPMIFFIGPGKTGTMSLKSMMEERGYTMCHNQCAVRSGGSRVPWRYVAWQEKAHHKMWADYDAFSDNGHSVDFRWLEETFPHARFVMNMRPLASWASSHIDFALQKRGVRVPVGFEALRGMLHVAMHQKAALAYFSEKPNRLNRFAMLDIVTMHPADVDDILDWVTRRRPMEDTAKRVYRVVRSAADLPPAARHNGTRVAAESLHRNSGKLKSTGTAEKVRELLLQHGCSAEQLASDWFDDCMSVAVRHDRDLTVLEQSWREMPPWDARMHNEGG
jgi:hypothetical protein